MSTNATPYPTSHAIEDMFSSQGGVATRHETLSNIIDDHVDAKVVGYDHYYSGEHKSKDSLMKNFFGDLFVLPWAAIEAKATAKTKTGKKFVNEHVMIVRFNDKGKIIKYRTYVDTHHCHSHALDQGKTS